MNLKLKRTPGIYLVGFMGSGKTTVGRLFSEEIGWLFADLDDDIERAQKATINELFERLGEEEFRRIETNALRERVRRIQRGVPMVLALGGGAFAREENIELLRDNGTTVWLDTDFDIMTQRVAAAVHRPLARDPEKFAQLFEQRRPLYARAEHHIRIDTNDSRAAVRALLSLQLLS